MQTNYKIVSSAHVHSFSSFFSSWKISTRAFKRKNRILLMALCPLRDHSNFKRKKTLFLSMIFKIILDCDSLMLLSIQCDCAAKTSVRIELHQQYNENKRTEKKITITKFVAWIAKNQHRIIIDFDVMMYNGINCMICCNFLLNKLMV